MAKTLQERAASDDELLTPEYVLKCGVGRRAWYDGPNWIPNFDSRHANIRLRNGCTIGEFHAVCRALGLGTKP